MEIPELIVKTLLCHPTPDILNDKEVDEARKKVKLRYRELRRQIGFTEAEIKAKVEWVAEMLKEKK